MFSDLMYIISDRLKDMNLFSNVYPLARRVTDKKNYYPVIYEGNGQGKPLKWDRTSGMCYFRKRSSISFNENTDENLRMNSCDDSIIYNITVPLRLVVFINAGKADCNNEFSSDFFAEWINGEISGVLDVTGIHGAKLVSNGYETDSISVLQSEYSNADEIGDISYQYCYLYIDFNLNIIANQACLNSCVSSVISGGSTTETLAMQPYKIAITPNTHSDYATLIGVIAPPNKVFRVPGIITDKSKVFVLYNGQFTANFTVTNMATGEITLGFIPQANTQLTIFWI